jgi:hypothetical protein
MLTLPTSPGAVKEIIEQSASEILKMYLIDFDGSDRKWTPVQAWLLIRALAETDSVSLPFPLPFSLPIEPLKFPPLTFILPASL